MAKRKVRKRRRTTSEKVMIVLGIIIALSMLFSLFVGLGSSGDPSNAPLPESERFNETLVDPAETIGALDAGTAAPIALLPVGAMAPPSG